MRALKKLIYRGAFFMLLPGTISLFAQPQPGTLLWSYNTPYAVTACPAIAPDGTIYLGTQGALYAITNAGSNKWSFTSSLAGSPAIGQDGTVYFGTASSNLIALNPDASMKWVYAFQTQESSSPAIGLDGTIYIAAEARLWAFSLSGTNKWKYFIGNETCSPVIGQDGTIYIGNFTGDAIFAINPDGSLKWSSGLLTTSGNSGAIGADGTIYIAGGPLYAFNPSGTNLWTTSIGDFSTASPAIGKDGTIYVGNPNDTSLWSIKPNGQTNWSAVPSSVFRPPPPTTPAIDASGLVYYCNSNRVYALTPQGNVQWTFIGPSGVVAQISPAIGPDGTIYAPIGTTLYAIAGTNALGNTPWPMYRQNLRHTGKLEKPSLSQLTKRPDANFQFEMFGEVGQPYTIQRSTNLASWAILTNFIASTQTTSVVDFTASNSPARFYRALIQ